MRAWAVMVVLAGLAACGVVDADGDGVEVRLDCDDADPAVTLGATWYVDRDGDLFGDGAIVACAVPEGAVAMPGDCDDLDPSIYPGAAERCDALDNDCNGVADDVSPDGVELCNGVDDDCDGEVDEDPADAGRWYWDGDRDGWGAGLPLDACAPPRGFVEQDGDCDDADADTWPGAPERCDGQDNDCDGIVDDGAVGERTWYADRDLDGYGDPDNSAVACDAPAGFVSNGDDCDDTDRTTSPDTWWFTDGDGDGVGVVDPTATRQCEAPAGRVRLANDCDDADPTRYPGAPEICDGLDQDCDADIDEEAIDAIPWYVDDDEDGLGDDAAFTIACEPSHGRVAAGGDCDDDRADVGTGMPEVCDGVDNDCDALVDHDDPDVLGAAPAFDDVDGDGFGGAGGAWTCFAPPWTVTIGGDCDDDDDHVFPGAAEVCDGVDDDCDGWIDSPDALGATAWYADADGDLWGDDGAVVWACAGLPGEVDRGGDCDDADPAVHPLAVERCDDLADLDCDGRAGGGDADGDGLPSCDDCDDGDPGVHRGAEERCDGVDQDCDGLVDEDDAGAYPWRAYADVDGDRYGRDGGWIVWCGGAPPSGYTASAGDCDDADADVFPGAVEQCNRIDDDCDGVIPADEVDADGDREGPLTCGGTDCDDDRADVGANQAEVCGDGVDNDCDGVVDPCGLAGDRAVSSAEASWHGRASGDKLGRVVTLAGDVNGDGAVDLVVGAPTADDDGMGSGTTYLLYGPFAPGPMTDISVAAGGALTGTRRFQNAGEVVGAPGDVNGDGYDDVLIGAPFDKSRGWWSGVAFLVHGPVSGVVSLTDADAVFAGEFGGMLAGTALGGGDFDDDGYADVLVSSAQARYPAGDGAVCLHPGPTSGPRMLMDAPACLVGDALTDAFGSSMHVGGDTDGDGRADLLVGDMSWDGGRGAASVWTELTPGLTPMADATAVLPGVAADDTVSAVASAGDVDGDGYDDVIVGARFHQGSGTRAGAAFVLRGPLVGEHPLVDADATLLGEASGDFAGSHVAGAGDVDADGFADVFVGASESDAGAGAAYVVRGPVAGTMRLGDAYGRVRGATPGGAAATVTAVGDLNGDGAADLVLGEPGGDGPSGGEGVLYLLWGALP
jgi:hypothetical protein